MAIVVGTILQSPLTHTCGDSIGYLRAKWCAVLDGVNQSLVGLLVEILAHLSATEHAQSEIVGRVVAWRLDLYGLLRKSCFEHLKS